MRPLAIRRGEEHGRLAGTILCHDVRPPFRKGHMLRAEDIPVLVAASWNELHVIELAQGDISQREAGRMLAEILASDGVDVAPAGHRHVLRARRNGLLKIDAPALQRINSIRGIAVFTLHNDSVVAAGQVVAEAQITPLAIERAVIDQVAREAGIVRLLSFVPRDVVVVTNDDEVFRAVAAKLRWFGCRTIEQRNHLQLVPDVSLVVVSGTNALDPLDPTFVALEKAGATMQRVGLPVHPGTLFWIASCEPATIIGLPSCGVGAQVTAFDLVLPKLLAEGAIRDEELAALGHGGILTHTRSRMLTMEAVDESVR